MKEVNNHIIELMQAGEKPKEYFLKRLPEYANQYIDLCMEARKEVATGSGKIVEIKDRHLPTITYFLQIWMPRNVGKTISRVSYYNWLRGFGGVEKEKAIEAVDELFKALAIDIVANEGKGIFYAKNKLGMTDRVESRNLNTEVSAEFGSKIIHTPQEPSEDTQLD